MGKLYIVGTPIGNLGDFSPRGIETLKQVDFIAAEDTRVTSKLLARFEITKPMVSYYEHNLRERGEQIVNRLCAGESCAIVTDAGMPCISDPGEKLVALCSAHNIEVVAVPGPSAVITALALSGMDTGRFTFEGFLSMNKSSRRTHLLEIAQEPRTMVFYEAPHKLKATLADLYKTLGNRKIALCREITKIYEQVLQTTLQDAIALYNSTEPRGEFVLVIAGAPPIAQVAVTLEDAVALAKSLLAEGIGTSAAAKQAALQTGLKKGDIYRAISAFDADK